MENTNFLKMISWCFNYCTVLFLSLTLTNLEMLFVLPLKLDDIGFGHIFECLPWHTADFTVTNYLWGTTL